ncbi:DNA/RNA non-specific endonuclease [Sphingomonas nostoxanthinifaciens]|nr:DNA/RNA non-specific endonuclease [Sphingomonas nostoxanthinifaciens]
MILVDGKLTFAPGQRSRSAQASAGGSDRLPTDDGGHYIAVRFNGPSDTFNHFAQDANFNRGGYRVLESEWAKDIKQGKQVYVAIVPVYMGSSKRPRTLAVESVVDGVASLRLFQNSSKGKSHGK